MKRLNRSPKNFSVKSWPPKHTLAETDPMRTCPSRILIVASVTLISSMQRVQQCNSPERLDHWIFNCDISVNGKEELIQNLRLFGNGYGLSIATCSSDTLRNCFIAGINVGTGAGVESTGDEGDVVRNNHIANCAVGTCPPTLRAVARFSLQIS